MNKRNRIAARAGLVLLAALVAGCAPSQRESDGRRDGIRIGFSVDSLVVERWTRDTNAFIEAGEALGAEVLYRNALEDSDRQARDLVSLRDEGIDALVVIPFDSQELAPVIREIEADGVPVIAYDRLILNAPISAYLSFDNVEVGRLLARGVTSRLEEARVVVVNGGARDNNSAMLREGIFDVLGPLVESGAYEVVAELSPSDWLPALFTDDLEAIIESGTPVDAIIAANDSFADAAIEILARHRLAGDVIVVGQDADLVATQRLVTGIQHRTIYKPVPELARRAAEIAVALAQGERVQTQRTIANGHGDVPYLAIEPVAVEADNIDATVIADGFHRREDVYLDSAAR